MVEKNFAEAIFILIRKTQEYEIASQKLRNSKRKLLTAWLQYTVHMPRIRDVWILYATFAIQLEERKTKTTFLHCSSFLTSTFPCTWYLQLMSFESFEFIATHFNPSFTTSLDVTIKSSASRNLKKFNQFAWLNFHILSTHVPELPNVQEFKHCFNSWFQQYERICLNRTYMNLWNCP